MARYASCAARSPHGTQCVLDPGHPGTVHCDVNGRTWPRFGLADDAVNNPPHYTHGAVEPIDAIEAWGLNYRLGNVVKYIARHEHKGSALRDLEKARWYLDREIEKRRESEGQS